jgi:hypothetical protein
MDIVRVTAGLDNCQFLQDVDEDLIGSLRLQIGS